jgi:hypothetical protein
MKGGRMNKKQIIEYLKGRQQDYKRHMLNSLSDYLAKARTTNTFKNEETAMASLLNHLQYLEGSETEIQQVLKDLGEY